MVNPSQASSPDLFRFIPNLNLSNDHEMENPRFLTTDVDKTPSTQQDQRHGFLFGYPIAHSLAPLLHNTLFSYFDLPWRFSPLESTDMPHFLTLLQDPNLFGPPTLQNTTPNLFANHPPGSAVTMPHKIDIIPHLSSLTPEALAVGAVNTIFRQGTDLVGTNTDTIGVRESFYQNVSDPHQIFHNRPGLVIGGGGAARSAVYALVKFMRCRTVYLVNRDPGEVAEVVAWCGGQGYGEGLVHVRSVEEAEKLEGPGAVVACVPNFPPVTEGEKEARRVAETFLGKQHKGAMLEMCYHPTPWTELGAIAERKGWQVILGTEAMIYQGLEQHRFWHGMEVEREHVQKIREVVARELEKARL